MRRCVNSGRAGRQALRIAGFAASLWLATAGASSSAHAQISDIDAAWRTLFQRPSAPPPAPPENPIATERVALGAKLFSDPRLSGDGKRACTTCHILERAFTDGRRRARGLSGADLPRNTPSLWNLAWSKLFFWDGRASTLEEQVALPIEAADEMGGQWPAILTHLNADTDLVAEFRAAFPGEEPMARETIVKALASYVRSLVSPATRFDAWIGGDARALTASEQRGFSLFIGKAGCVLCHAGWRFTDDQFHDVGLPSADPGRGGLKEGTPGLKAFKTPSLREVARTGPYMHDGSLPTLAAVIKHYAGGFRHRPSLAPSMKRNLKLTARERADLVAFLGTLSTRGEAP